MAAAHARRARRAAGAAPSDDGAGAASDQPVVQEHPEGLKEPVAGKAAGQPAPAAGAGRVARNAAGRTRSNLSDAYAHSHNDPTSQNGGLHWVVSSPLAGTRGRPAVELMH